jgi:L1 cell adhesion molecule like protein
VALCYNLQVGPVKDAIINRSPILPNATSAPIKENIESAILSASLPPSPLSCSSQSYDILPTTKHVDVSSKECETASSPQKSCEKSSVNFRIDVPAPCSYSNCDGNDDLADDPTEEMSPGARLNIDNLDVRQEVRHMTVEHQNEVKHYVQSMVVEDRVNVERLPLETPQADLLDLDNSTFLPTIEDVNTLRQDCIEAAALILTEHVPVFKKHFGDLIPKVFQHQYSGEMKNKSNVIPCGIYNKNENKTNDLIDIMTDLQEKVTPGARTENEMLDLDERDDTYASMRPLPLGGDQLTCERCRGAHYACADGDAPEERLEGLFCMIEDFHEKMNFLQATMDKLYKGSSVAEAGTLYQLRNLINRRNVVGKVSKDYHADADFIDMVTDCHVIAATMAYFHMDSIDDKPAQLPHRIECMSDDNKRLLLRNMVGQVIDHYMYNTMAEVIDDVIEGQQVQQHHEEDYIFNYATGVLKFGLIRRVAVMTTAAGDGERALRHWKFAMLVYDQAGKIKYRLEAFLFIASVRALLPARLGQQIIHNRFVNLTGGEGNNLDGDYVMELLNNKAKQKIKQLGPNHTPQMVMQIGKTLNFCHDVAKNVEYQMNVAPISREKTIQSLHHDRMLVLEELVGNACVFTYTPGREHPSFPEHPIDIFADVKAEQIHKWLHAKKGEYARTKAAF